jgi:large-conductance mechanosensitive channel
MPKQTRKRKSPVKPSNAQVVAVGTPIRLEKPRSKRKPKATPAEVAVVVAHEINPASGFLTFLREHAIVGLAVGFAIATQVQALVKQLVTSFIDPLYGLFFTQKLSEHTFVLHWNDRAQTLTWGAFAYSMLNFIFVLAAIYILIKFFNLDNWDKPKKDADK